MAKKTATKSNEPEHQFPLLHGNTITVIVLAYETNGKHFSFVYRDDSGNIRLQKEQVTTFNLSTDKSYKEQVIDLVRNIHTSERTRYYQVQPLVPVASPLYFMVEPLIVDIFTDEITVSR
jgi:hypothetical protein